MTEHPRDDPNDGDARIAATASSGKTRGREDGGMEEGQSLSKAA